MSHNIDANQALTWSAPLFERTTRTVWLTAQGQALLEPARGILSAVDGAARTVRYADAGTVGTVSLGFAGPSSHSLISQLARQVRREQPGIELHLRSTTYGTKAISEVQEGLLDLAVVHHDSTPPSLHSRVVQVERYVAVLPAAHPLAGRESVSMAQLREESWVLLDPASGSSLRELTLRKAHEAGFALDIVQHASDSWTIMALVAAGVGVTVTVDTSFRSLTENGLAVVPLEWGKDYALARLMWRAGNANPALARVLELSESTLPTPDGWQSRGFRHDDVVPTGTPRGSSRVPMAGRTPIADSHVNDG